MVSIGQIMTTMDTQRYQITEGKKCLVVVVVVVFFVCVCVCVCVKQINSRFDSSFYYYLVSYNTTGVLHSSDKMTECELTLAG